MKKSHRNSLQKTILIYFLLIVIAASFVGIEFVRDTNKQTLKDSLLLNMEQLLAGEISYDTAFEPIRWLRNKAIIMICIILFVMFIVFTIFVKNVTEPLQHMIDVAKQISGGNLSKSVQIQANNELEELGNVINELTSNLQEIIQLSGNLCQSGRQSIEKASAILNNRTENMSSEAAQDILDELATEFYALEEMVNDITLYSVE